MSIGLKNPQEQSPWLGIMPKTLVDHVWAMKQGLKTTLHMIERVFGMGHNTWSPPLSYRVHVFCAFYSHDLLGQDGQRIGVKLSRCLVGLGWSRCLVEMKASYYQDMDMITKFGSVKKGFGLSTKVRDKMSLLFNLIFKVFTKNSSLLSFILSWNAALGLL